MKTERQVQTIAGYFGEKRIGELRDVLKGAESESVMFEGQELLVSFGNYLLEFVEGEYARLNHGGL